MSEFSKLGIIEPILKAIDEEKFEKPTEVQLKTIPLVLEGKDVVAGSATGSGKTLSFGAGIIQNCTHGKGIQALILTPTRELAEQIKKALNKFSKYKFLDIVDVYGGLSINPQIDKLRHADVVVGTPGRILDHIDRRTINLSKVKILVLDEADRMVDMGFIDDVESIIKQCPRERQTLLYSATITDEVDRIHHRYMRNPIKVSAVKQVDPKLLKQVYYDVDEKMKLSLLVHLLKQEHPGLVMVFCNSRNSVDFVESNLNKNCIQAEAIHGGFSQAKRSKVIDSFHAKDVFVLVCTDVAARGLDIPGVSHVYNFDLPAESKQYIHRIGRTARAGQEGKAINLLARRDYENFTRITRDFALEIPKEPTPEIQRVQAAFKPRGRFGGGFGGRGGGFGRRSNQGGEGFGVRLHGHGTSGGRPRQGYGHGRSQGRR